MLRFFVDSDMDLSPKDCEKYGCRLISMPYIIDGREYLPYTDSETFDFKAFYDLLRKGVIPSTSGISMMNYIDYFEPVFAAGDDILYVHFSSAMTNTFQSMHLALEELAKKYPERKFYEIDTMGITTISRAIAEQVGEMLLSGASIDEIMAKAEDIVSHTAMYFMADDLKFFHKSGRVSGLSAVMGGVIGIKPIIYMSAEGTMVSCGKERGRGATIARLVKIMEDIGEDVEKYPIYIGNTDAPALVELLEARIRERFGENLDIRVIPVNPTTGSHCGPDGVGVCFHAKHR